MIDSNNEDIEIDIPGGLIVFISGVPGVGKSTISLELLRAFSKFRIIEETDLVREILKGYNEYIRETFKEEALFLFDSIEIKDHGILLNIDEAKQQCAFMKKSFQKIVERQQRKGIPSIINGVHVIPEILDGIADNHNVVYVNLYVTSEHELYCRLSNRDPHSYMLNHIPYIFHTNNDLYASTARLTQNSSCIFHNIDVTALTINETITKVTNCIKRRLAGI